MMRLLLLLFLTTVPMHSLNLCCAEEQPVLQLFIPLLYPEPEVINERGREQLSLERKLFAKEIKELLLWNSDIVKKFVPVIDAAEEQILLNALDRDALNTVQDNLERFTQALSRRIPDFGKSYALFKTEKHLEATGGFDALMEEKVTLVKAKYQHNVLPPMIYALIRYHHAESKGRIGDLKAAAIGFRIVQQIVPRTLTLGARASACISQLYIETGRFHYAIPFLRGVLERYGDLLTDEEILLKTITIQRMARDEDPYVLAARNASAAASRLSRLETGNNIQHAQQEVIRLLQQMLAMAEEEERPFLEHTDTLAEAGEGGELRAGGLPKALLSTANPALGGDDDWGKLKPRERQQLLETLRETFPVRYGKMLEEYYRNLSRQESQAGE